MSVKVAVRVRPFNKRQKDLGCQCIVQMQDPSTTLKTVNKEDEKSFTFDYSFWSFDQFVENEQTGYLSPAGKKYADQKQVYEKIGTKILDNAWEGYHCCLFAYGQTGSGKSYSMIGYGANKGIVPIVCDEIFKQTLQRGSSEIEYEVYASMLEIYNEKIQDLTVPVQKRPSAGLKIRENKLLGIYVDGVKKHFVQNYEEIQKVMEEGTKNRTVAATQMNATSSRAHTIITIQFKQINSEGQLRSQKVSMINLVDLAGSQRQDKTGATGQRLKEAVGINQSLTTLGQVISVLAQNAQGANKFVPYRNSALTRILQNALGGNSQTYMICAISPANDNYDETLSTLRYAQRAKKIKNKPIVNESQTDKLIRQLRQENARLKKLLQQKDKNYKPNETMQEIKKEIKDEPNIIIKQEQGENKEDNEMDIENLRGNLFAIQNMLKMEEQSKQQKIEQAKKDQVLMDEIPFRLSDDLAGIFKESTFKQYEKKQKGNMYPYFQNISRDIMLNRKLKIILRGKKMSIGKLGANPKNDIVFSGRDMLPHHAIIQRVQDKVFLIPQAQNIHLYVNGAKVTRSVELVNLDRVIFGWNSVYLFKKKETGKVHETIQDKEIDWQFCKNEVKHLVDIDQEDLQLYVDVDCCRLI